MPFCTAKIINLKRISCLAVSIALVLFISNQTQAQTNNEAPAPTNSQKTSTTPTKSSSSDKIDLKKLEDKYWSAKDDDYGVIQNRTFAKKSKFYLSLVYGPLINDPFTKARALGGMLGYYLTEDFGIELSRFDYSSQKSDTVSAFESQFSGTRPDYNLIKANTALSLTYTPFYAKMAFMNKAIMYFDMGFTLGMGLTDYEIQKVDKDSITGATTSANEVMSAPHFEIGVMQQLFLSQYFAFRLDIKNTFYQQKSQQYEFANVPGTTRKESTKSTNDTTITFGLTVFTK